MSTVLYRAMLSKVRALLKVEASHNKEERQSQQWQLLFDIDGVQYIVGKGGVNTTFYQIGDGKRKLLYPDELIQFLESLTKSKYQSYAICAPSGKVVKSGFTSEDSAKAQNPPIGYYLVGFSDGKKKRLFIRQQGIFKNVWNPFLGK